MTLQIALVNNMPDAALRATERQFAAVFAGSDVQLRLYSLPGIPREAAGLQHVEEYEPFGALLESQPDGVVVTGMMPRPGLLNQEPWWPGLTWLADWAQRRGVPVLWSCLAAHAAVLHLDRVARRPMPGRVHGVYPVQRIADHLLVRAMPPTWHVPHSRWNEVPAEALDRAGYQILAHSPRAGADVFVRECGALFTFLQGHPEYDATALLREYRRDVTRALAGTSSFQPRIPCGYLTAGAEAALAQARRNQTVPDLDALEPQKAFWHPDAVRLYAGWLATIRARVPADAVP